MDTVEPAQNKTALLNDGIITSDGTSVLGADDVSGITVILEALERLIETHTPHYTVELLFPVAEELYGLGSAHADYASLHARRAYTLDLSGKIGVAANAAPTIISFKAAFHGRASHAGFAPQDGVHAIAAAARAVSRVPLGYTRPGITCNIGVISGGEAGNIIPQLCMVSGEIRGFNHEAALEVLGEVGSIFREEAEREGATVDFEPRVEITAYETPSDCETVDRFRRACKAVGVDCVMTPTLGGSDNNNFALHGITGLVIACSMHEVHSTREYCRLDELELCVRLVMRLLTEDRE